MLFIACSPPKLPSVSTWDWLLISRDITPYEGHNRHRPQTTSAIQRSSVLCAWARRLTSAGLSLLYCVSPHSQRRLCPPHSLRASLQLLALSGRLPATWFPTPGGLRDVAGPVVACTMGQGRELIPETPGRDSSSRGYCCPRRDPASPPIPQNSPLRPLKLQAPSRRYPLPLYMRDEQNLEKDGQRDCEFKATLNYREGDSVSKSQDKPTTYDSKHLL